MQRLLSLAALLAVTTFPVLADERMEHAEWVSEFREGTGEASTKDASMAKFGMLCGEESCRYYYDNGINCEPGSTYPIVIATSAGSIAVETVCAPAEGETTRYWFTDLPQFNDALMQSDTVGIAFPLASGQFKISQFLMNGFGEAVERVAAGMRALRAEREARESAERERRTREAEERARKAQEVAERARKAQEAERARKAAEQEAAERERIAAEKEAAERARIAAEKEAAERARVPSAQDVSERKLTPEDMVAPQAVPATAEHVAAPATPAAPAATPSETAKEPAASTAVGNAAGDNSSVQPADTEESSSPATSPSPRGKRLPSNL